MKNSRHKQTVAKFSFGFFTVLALFFAATQYTNVSFASPTVEYCCSSDKECERVTREGNEQICWFSSQACSEEKSGFCAPRISTPPQSEKK